MKAAQADHIIETMATHSKEAAALGDTVVEISKGLIRTHQEPKQQSHAS